MVLETFPIPKGNPKPFMLFPAMPAKMIPPFSWRNPLEDLASLLTVLMLVLLLATSYSSLLSWVYSCWWCWYQYLYHSVYAGICIGLAACGDDTVLTRYWHLNWSCCGRGWCCCWHWADSSQYGGMSVVFFHSTRYSSSSLLRVKASLCKLQRGFENGSCSVTSEKEVKRKRCESDVKTMWKWCKIDVKYIDFTSISRRFYVTFTTIAKKDELSRIKRTIQYNTHSNNTIKLTT